MSGAGGLIGMGLQAIGQMKADGDEAFAHYQNSQEYEQQAQYTEKVGARKLHLLKLEQDDFFGKQEAQIASSNIDFGGSTIDFLAKSRQEMRDEQISVKAQTEQESRVLRMKGQQEGDASSALKSPIHLLGMVGGTVSKNASIFGSG